MSRSVSFIGMEGCTQDCVEAVARLVETGVSIRRAVIVTCASTHGMLLVDDCKDIYAVRAGFTSGYLGEGPRGLSRALGLLQFCGVDIEEVLVAETILEKLNDASLSDSEIGTMITTPPLRPQRWRVWTLTQDAETPDWSGLLASATATPPFAIVDVRLQKLALEFVRDSDAALHKAFRLLEETLRSRTGCDDIGVDLATRAFLGKNPLLKWEGIGENESTGRGLLFLGAIKAYRNPRAHQLLKRAREDDLLEFLLVNQLFRLEAQAKTTGERA